MVMRERGEGMDKRLQIQVKVADEVALSENDLRHLARLGCD